jgi:putative toxin-antitoxin system antitoxin component (TIGR02293 family)
MTAMAKSAKPKKYSTEAEEPSKAEEHIIEYRPVKRLPVAADFPYRKFEKIAALVPFTQKEWANMLHLSERTLQRYSKDNSSFEGIYVDRILQLEQMIQMGLETFTDAAAFYRWLQREKKVLGHVLNFESLYSTQGIQDITDQIGRIQYGVYT